MIKRILPVFFCILSLCLISCAEKKTYDESFVINVMNMNNSDLFEQNKLLVEFNIKPDSKKYIIYKEFKESLLSDPAFFERNSGISELWVNYTSFIDNFETAFKNGRYSIFDFPGISDEDFLLIYNKGRPSNLLLKIYNKFTDLEQARIKIWEAQQFHKILNKIAEEDLKTARNYLNNNVFPSAKAAYKMINIENPLSQSEYDYLLNKARVFAKNKNKTEMFAVYDIINDLDNSKLTGTDLYNKANFSNVSKYEKNHLFAEAYERYLEQGVSEGSVFEYVKKAKEWCQNMADGFKSYGGDWSLYQVDNRVERKALRREHFAKDYVNQMQHILLNEDGSIETYSKNYKNFFWEYSPDESLQIRHWNSDEKFYENCGGLNSQGYIAINGMTIMNNSKPAYVTFFFTKD